MYLYYRHYPTINFVFHISWLCSLLLELLGQFDFLFNANYKRTHTSKCLFCSVFKHAHTHTHQQKQKCKSGIDYKEKGVLIWMISFVFKFDFTSISGCVNVHDLYLFCLFVVLQRMLFFFRFPIARSSNRDVELAFPCYCNVSLHCEVRASFNFNWKFVVCVFIVIVISNLLISKCVLMVAKVKLTHHRNIYDLYVIRSRIKICIKQDNHYIGDDEWSSKWV